MIKFRFSSSFSRDAAIIKQWWKCSSLILRMLLLPCRRWQKLSLKYAHFEISFISPIASSLFLSWYRLAWSIIRFISFMADLAAALAICRHRLNNDLREAHAKPAHFDNEITPTADAGHLTGIMPSAIMLSRLSDMRHWSKSAPTLRRLLPVRRSIYGSMQMLLTSPRTILTLIFACIMLMASQEK